MRRNMGQELRYRRVVIKLSGEAFCQPGGYGIDPPTLNQAAEELADIARMGAQVALVVGGGNVIRGGALVEASAQGAGHIERVSADYMGMLATVINAIALRDTLEGCGVEARVFSAIPVEAVCEPFSRRKAIQDLDAGRVVIFAGGTGSPFFTTDMCAALRASEIDADVVLKATKVDGVFDADPLTDPAAKKYDTLTYAKFLDDQLGVMDLTAIMMCMQRAIPIVVFRFSKKGNIARALAGEAVGTTITENTDATGTSHGD